MGPTADSMIRSLHDALGRQELSERTKKAALEATAALAKPGSFIELLRLLHGDLQMVEACARQSYLHPLGFHKLMLVNAPPLFELRCHVWWPDSSPGADHVHDHRFSFISAVVRGGYQMEIFKTDPTGVLALEYQEIGSPSTGWHLNPIGTTRLRLLFSTQHEQGTSYALEADALHRVIVSPGNLCITLVLRTALTGSKTRVFANPSHTAPAKIPVRVMSGDDYRRQLEALLIELTS